MLLGFNQTVYIYRSLIILRTTPSLDEGSNPLSVNLSVSSVFDKLLCPKLCYLFIT